MRQHFAKGDRRGWRLRGILVLAAIAAISLAFRALDPELFDVASSGKGPIVIYLVDTLRFDRMSAYGATRQTSPAAQRLAAEGERFDAAYSVTSWTRPAVASLFTSRWPSESGAVGRFGTLHPGTPTMAGLFRANGWQTAAFCGQPNIYGKELGFQRGFGYFAVVPPREGDIDEGVTTADRVVAPAIQWIESQRSPRFLLYVHVVDPHNGDTTHHPSPYMHWLPGYENLFSDGTPMDLNSRDWRLSKYDALIRQSDDQFSHLRAALEKKGFWKDALVVYLADHGEEFYEHGGLYHGQSLFEELVRIPLIVKGPSWGKPGRVEKSPVSLLDLLPSIAHWAGLPSDERWRGKPIDRGEADPRRTIFFSEELENWRLYGIRKGQRKMIASLDPPFRIQFDLARDPGEQNPVPDEIEMTRALERYRRTELTSYGGLRILKTGIGPATIQGVIDLPDGSPPYLALSDRERFPLDLNDPAKLRISVTIRSEDAFDVHLAPPDGRPALAPHLTIVAGGVRRQLEAGFTGRADPFEITNAPTSRLSPAEMSELTKRMRALGYLGGGGAE